MNTSKYGNRKTVVNGITFDSKLEAKRYNELVLLQKAKLISELQLQFEFILQDGFIYDGKKERAIKYKADFYYKDNKLNKYVCEDAKGFKTKEYAIKRKLLLFKYPDLIFREIVK